MKKNIRLLLLASFLCIFLFGNMVLAATPKAPSPAPAPKAPVTTPLSAPDKAIKDTTISIQKANLKTAISFYDKLGNDINYHFGLSKYIEPGTIAFLKKEKAVLLAQTNPEIVSTREKIYNSLSLLIDEVIAAQAYATRNKGKALKSSISLALSMLNFDLDAIILSLDSELNKIILVL